MLPFSAIFFILLSLRFINANSEAAKKALRKVRKIINKIEDNKIKEELINNEVYKKVKDYSKNYTKKFKTLDEMYIPGEKEVCLHITIYMKIPGYDPKHSLYFKRDLKNLDKEKTNSYSKNKSSLLDGGEGGI